MKNYIFISHSTKDDEFVKSLRKNLENQNLATWVDSRELAPGNKLEPEIKQAIENAGVFIVVLSPKTINSRWVRQEIKYARQVEQKRQDDYKLIPIMLEGFEADALELYFDEEPVGVKVQIGPGGVSAAMPQLLAALGERLPDAAQPMLRPLAKPLEELLLELTDPCMVEKDGIRRAQATAELTYFPAEKGKREVTSKGRFSITAPLGPIENDELGWYLERYYTWPAGVFKQRAQNIEKQLPKWGKMLYSAAFGDETTADVLAAWKAVKTKTARRFTVFVDSQLVKGTEPAKQTDANEAATLLLGLPWELLHDNRGYLFQGAKPMQVRRRLPNRKTLDRTVAEPPIRILLVSPRPEDERAGYIDHRASALPLVTALESLGELVELTVLVPPTFPALEQELQRAQAAETAYHVVHFDGHGVFSKALGLGGLCFEEPQDRDKLEQRRSQIIDARELAAVIRDYRIPLFFLEACETAKAEEDPTASVAAALLDQGVASVVAMSFSVLVETARRFVQSFYQELATGSRVGEAMLAGQRALKSDSFRLKIFGAGRLDLQDWFVPVLYQEKEDLQLLTRVPSREIKAIDRQALKNRFGALPPSPEHHFIGRSRELLKLERLLAQKNYAVLCGQGGEGKTTLAAELARWLVRSNRFYRVVFVCVEAIYNVRTVVDRIGRQLVVNYSVAEYAETDLFTKALLPIERQLRNQRVLLILDNMESILPSTTDATDTVVARFEPEALKTFFDLCEKLLALENTRLLFTSREALPPPFDRKFQRVTLGRLAHNDAIELVHRSMTAAGLTPKEDDLGSTPPEIKALVEAVNCHARSLALLAPFISQLGLRHTTANLGRLMTELHQKYPNERQRSLFASVELSLRRLSPEIRQKIKPLGVFQGGAHLENLQYVLELSDSERDLLVRELIEIGLAERMDYGFLRLHPALCPYLWGELDETGRAGSKAKWAKSMQQLSDFLIEQRSKDTQLAATLTVLELPNLMQLLEHVRGQVEAETTVKLATKLEQLIAQLGRPHLLVQVAAIRETESKKLGEWSHTGFVSARFQIERLLAGGDFSRALKKARALLDKCLAAGEGAYSEAVYDIAISYFLLGRVVTTGGASEAALQSIKEAYRRFQQLADQGNTSAAGMASASLTEQGDCLQDLGRLDQAAAAYEAGVQIAEKLGDSRGIAVKKIQLGTVRLKQERYKESLKAYDQALKTFENLGEAASVAGIRHQMGMVHEKSNQFESAEAAYRQSLAIVVQQNDSASEAGSLNQLGNLYGKMGRLEEAVLFHRQAAETYVEINDMAKEGVARCNIANTLIKLKCWDQAREEILRAIECFKSYGYDVEPWKAWNILCDLEQAEGNHTAAAQARQQAIQLYLAYRRAGGENHSFGGRLCLWFAGALPEQEPGEIERQLAELANNSKIASSLRPLIPKLQAILGGSRDPELAADPELQYTDAAEILFLLEKLGK